MITKKYQHRQRVIRRQRSARVGAQIHGSPKRPRLAVFRSLKHVSAQLIDDVSGRTLASAYDREVDRKLRGASRAAAVGALLAERGRAKGIDGVIFDRRHYRYHGQVRALAEAAREGGLVF